MSCPRGSGDLGNDWSLTPRTTANKAHAPWVSSEKLDWAKRHNRSGTCWVPPLLNGRPPRQASRLAPGQATADILRPNCSGYWLLRNNENKAPADLHKGDVSISIL